MNKQDLIRRLMAGQILLIVCFVFYLIWWYRGFRPGTSVNRTRGFNGVLLALTAAFGISGVAITLLSDYATASEMLKISPMTILIAGIVAYIGLLMITRFGFGRIVTSELLLIVAWTMLEVWVIDVLNGIGSLSETRFTAMSAVLGTAFIVSIVLYVAYYRMEEMRAFYAAMVPLAAAEVCMITLFGMVVL